MTSTKKGIVRGLLYAAVICALVSPVMAFADTEPILLVYPDKPAEFQYDQARYETLDASEDNYDPDYDVGGYTLWDKVEGRIAYEVYRAPHITGFVPSGNGMNQFVLMINEFWLIIDGFCESPRQVNEITARFVPDPPHASAVVMVNNSPLEFLITKIPGLNGAWQTTEGYYVSTTRARIWWSGAVGMRIIAYGDKNRNLVYDGGVPQWSIYVQDNTVPVRETTWGGIKNLFSD
jgi:hypothetical protein